MKLYQAIARTLDAYKECCKRNNDEGMIKHNERLRQLVDELPSGSGIDNGVKLDYDLSNPNKLVFIFGYHHMNEHGFYDGWTHHKLTVRPSLMFQLDLTINGKDRNQIKEYLHETFQYALTREIDNV